MIRLFFIFLYPALMRMLQAEYRWRKTSYHAVLITAKSQATVLDTCLLFSI